MGEREGKEGVKALSINGYSHIGSVETRAIEECAELIKALCKAERFGLESYHPDTPQTSNRQEILNEIIDVMRVLEELQQVLLLWRMEGTMTPKQQARDLLERIGAECDQLKQQKE